MLILQRILYVHPDKELLFENISMTVNRHEKIALVGNNGAGKSTLLKIMAGRLKPSSGHIINGAKAYYVPQLSIGFNDCTVAAALGVQHKLAALNSILEGNATEENFALLEDDWTIEERCLGALAGWQLHDVGLSQQMYTLSGGQKTKVLLAGIAVHRPEIVLLDEPSNHLDAGSRDILYAFIQSFTGTMVVVSHDRTLLNMLPQMYELSKKGITVYGGNYDFYAAQKAVEQNALYDDLKNKEKALRKAKETERETMERQQKLDARGRRKQEKSGLPTISLNTFRNNAEKSTARMKEVHAGKTEDIAQELDQLRKELPGKDKMKIGFDDTSLHTGKMLVRAVAVNYSYGADLLWKEPLSFEILSGDRIALQGNNGSGKTTLLQMILGVLQPTSGTLQRAEAQQVYIDQEYTLISNTLSVYEQVQQFNSSHLPEHELKSRLTHFLFTRADWNKPCAALSGGEKMRLVLCCLTVSSKAPDIIVLDEPANNLDMQNLEILAAAIRDYEGTIIVVSHDAYFLEQVSVEKIIMLTN